jgi:uridylate kinase
MRDDMTAQPKYKRVLLKLSGESLCEPGRGGIQASAVDAAADELLPALALDVQISLVVGGGNLFRARDLAGDPNILRVTADYMGMLGTVMNALALRDAIEGRGRQAVVMSAIPMPTVCEPFNRRDAVRHLDAGRVVLFAAGTGSPFFTTDTTAALRASEIGADLLVKATKVDGVYDCDPITNPGARKFDRLTYAQALRQGLAIMDQAALALCSDNRLTLVVCRLMDAGNLVKVLTGRHVGTIITA